LSVRTDRLDKTVLEVGALKPPADETGGTDRAAGAAVAGPGRLINSMAGAGRVRARSGSGRARLNNSSGGWAGAAPLAALLTNSMGGIGEGRRSGAMRWAEGARAASPALGRWRSAGGVMTGAGRSRTVGETGLAG
ncbi:MAG TPA: hypothetical protein PLP22_13155, partial [Candidatus Competibacter sp.]|nr:hypothetical protein [Candidatus Competibacter sp.]